MVGEFNVVYLILAEYHGLYETIVVESKTACSVCQPFRKETGFHLLLSDWLTHLTANQKAFFLRKRDDVS